MTVKLITHEALVELRRQARLQRKKEDERILDTTMREAIEEFGRFLSTFPASPAQREIRLEPEPEGFVVPVPELPSGESVGPYESMWGVRLILVAQAAAVPVLINFAYRPTKRFEETMRHSAKIRDCRLHFYRLIGSYVAIEVEPKLSPSELDARFLRKAGISAM